MQFYGQGMPGALQVHQEESRESSVGGEQKSTPDRSKLKGMEVEGDLNNEDYGDEGIHSQLIEDLLED